MRNAQLQLCGLVLAALLAGCCHQPTVSRENAPLPAEEEIPDLAFAEEEFPGGVIPSSFRVSPARPASRLLAVLPASSAPLEPPLPTPSQTSVAIAEHPIAEHTPTAELLPATMPGVVLLPAFVVRDEGRFSNLSAEGQRLAELERPTTIVTAPVDPPPAQPPLRNAEQTRSLATLIGRSVFSHAADYSWLVGVLHQAGEGGPGETSWVVRYAAGDREDQYGGVLALVSPEPMAGFRAGQLVLVEGDLVDPAPHEIKPAYHVRAIQHLQRP